MTEQNPPVDQMWKSEEMARKFLAEQSRRFPWQDRTAEVLQRLITGMDRPIGSFLDVGCGGGRIALWVLESCPDTRAVLTDFNETMLAAAGENVGSVTDRLTLVPADLTDAGWSAALADQGPFDLVVSGFAIHHLAHERKRDVYRDIFQMLQPGGLFANLEHVRSASSWGELLFDTWIADHLADHHALPEGQSKEEFLEQLRHRADRAGDVLVPVGEQCDWLRDIGYADVDCFMKIFEGALFGGRKPA
jgi:tRNA (cmo5U34)-methyltransferase